MLLSLEILNGTLSFEFDKYVDYYTVEVDDDTFELVMNYTLEEGYNIKIINNDNFDIGINMVYIEVYNELESNTYTLEVYKHKTSTVTTYVSEEEALEVEYEMSWYTPYIIGLICFILILICYLIIFKHKKNRN